MLSSKRRIKERQGKYGTSRFHYLQQLVLEFQKSSSITDRRQIVANLGNFAYDPINFGYLQKLNIIELFIDVLDEDDTLLKRFGISALCNCICDVKVQEILYEVEGIPLIHSCLHSNDEETISSTLTTLIYLLQDKAPTQNDIDQLLPTSIQNHIQCLRNDSNQIKNLITILQRLTKEIR